MAQKTKTAKPKTKKSTTKKSGTHSIATAGGGAPQTGAGFFAQFAPQAPVVTPGGKKVSDKDRPVLTIDDATATMVLEYGATKEILDVVKERQERDATELREAVAEAWAEFFWTKQRKPKTPKLEGKNEAGEVETTGQYIVQNYFTINMPDVQDGETALHAFVRVLTDGANALSLDNAEDLVQSELDFAPKYQFNFNSAEEQGGALQALAQKLFAAAYNCSPDGTPLDFDADGDAALVVSAVECQMLKQELDSSASYKVEVRDKESFMDRLCNYCDNKEQVLKVLKIIKPRQMLARFKSFTNDSLEDKNKRLVDAARTLVAEELGVTGTDD